MKKVLVRYKLKADKVEENETLVKEVYKQLHDNNVDGFHYITVKLADGVSFVHIGFADTEEANTAFSQLPAFRNFQANIKDRCEEPPVANQVTVIGSHNFMYEPV
jgi:quinol monooxygenase YgiN